VYGSRYRSRRFAALLRECLASGGYDLVQAEYSFMGAYRRDVAADTPWVLDEHNVEFRLNETLVDVETSWYYRAYGRRESRLRRSEELAACRLADHVLTVSSDDAALLRTAEPGLAISIVPNGVDVDAHEPASPETGGLGRLVFIGKMDYRPNVQAVRWFCSEVLPLVRRRHADVSLEIVGANPTQVVRDLGSIDGVTVAGGVPDTRPHLRAAQVVVIPLHAGSGTRLKVLEAFAAGKAVVSTRLGAEGLEVAHDRELLLADVPGDFAAAVGRALDDPGLRGRLGSAGRRLVEERYAWPRVVQRLEGVYAGLVGADK
jgi:glycosyltransferase involved in cell wall biosynthesis